MNKDYAGAVVYTSLVLCAAVLIAEYFTATRDNSWIGEVENFMKKENWEPNSEFQPMQDWAFFLYENGEKQYFYLESQNEFISCINNVMDRINRQVKESISEELLNDILASDKVLLLVHRFSTQSMGWGPTNEFDRNIDYRSAYFVFGSMARIRWEILRFGFRPVVSAKPSPKQVLNILWEELRPFLVVFASKLKSQKGSL